MNVTTANVKNVIVPSASATSAGFGPNGAAMRPACQSMGAHVSVLTVGLSDSACAANGVAAKLAGGHLGSDAPLGDLNLQISAKAGQCAGMNDRHGVEQLSKSIDVKLGAPLAEAPHCADQNRCAEPLSLQSSWLFQEDL